MAIGTTPCSLNDNTLVQFIYARALRLRIWFLSDLDRILARHTYGWPRIWRQLRAQGIRVGKQRVQRMMQKHGIQARGKRRFRVTTTDSSHNLPIAPNLLNRNFTVAAPNLAWV